MPDSQPDRSSDDWHESSRAGEPGGSQFMPTQFLLSPLEASVAAQHAALVFDACHVGVMLRALLLVHGVAAIGAMFPARSLIGWLALTAAASAIMLPSLLVWLLGVCLAKRPLARCPPALQRVLVMAFGALSALFGWSLGLFSGLELFDSLRWYGPAFTGAALAALMDQWLRMRAEARVPADAAARLAELQSRIRPHFLFNTLNTALSLVRLDPARAEGVLEDLAELFRVALTENGASASLADEVELARRYLAIEQIRFGTRLTLDWQFDPATGGARVPPLVLQPLVENAVRHGVEPASEGGTIRLRTRIQRGNVLVTISNTVPSQASRPGNGIALRNVRERLRLMHDVNSHFEARRSGNVFRVRLVVPLT